MSIRFGRFLRTAQAFSFAVMMIANQHSVYAADEHVQPARVQTASASPTAATPAPAPMVSPGEATPEMWFYEQAIQQYNNPKYAVRAAAEFKANQRRMRLAAMQWYGYSNSRPEMGIDNLHGPQQAQWVGNGADPNWWVAPARPAVIINVPSPSRY